MALKVLLKNRLAFILISLPLLLLALRPCRAAAETTGPVRLESLTVGVSRPAPRRYRVTDIKVGNVSVRHLFEVKPDSELAWWESACFWYVDFRFVITSGERLQALKQVLIAHPGRPVEVVLKAERFPVLGSLPGLSSEDMYEKSILIPVQFEMTTCDDVTRVIYQKIVSTVKQEEKGGPLREEMAGEAAGRLDVNELFDKLRDDDEIETYIRSLNSVTNTPCAETVRLLNSLEEKKLVGFESGEYFLKEDLRYGLDLIIDGMKNIDSRWSMYNLSLKVTGYTDNVRVDETKDRQLLVEETGVGAGAWGRISNPLEVYYSGCNGDKVRRELVYVGFVKGGGELRVEGKIKNNCELGAVRAYVTLVYLTGKLGRLSTDDSYATGGIFSGPGADEHMNDDPSKRRIQVEITVKAAAKGK